jgi:hypothetical protein
MWYSSVESMIKSSVLSVYLNINLYTGTAELEKNKDLSPTASIVLQLAKSLLYTTYQFSVFCDNLFTKSKLFKQLQALGIGACGTA